MRSKRKGFAFICETPLHVFNAINFVANDLEGSRDCSDIYVYHSFRDSAGLSYRLSKTKLFNHVYNIKPYDESKCSFSRLRILFRLFFPRLTLKKHIKERVALHGRTYQHLVMYSYTMRNRNFLGTFKNADIIMMEDGIGAYFGNQMQDYVDGFYKLLDQYIFRKRYSFIVQRLYVYRPDICSNDIECDLKVLPSVNQDNPVMDLAYDIYNYTYNEIYKRARFVYFTQPLHLIPGDYKDSSEWHIIKIMAQVCSKDNIVFRIHPRQSEVQLHGCLADIANNFWELEAHNSITDDHVLVSAFSTAAFTAYYMNNTEPTLIFTYKIQFRNCDGSFWCNIESFISKLKCLYTDPTKVYVPENYDELKHILNDLLMGREEDE